MITMLSPDRTPLRRAWTGTSAYRNDPSGHDAANWSNNRY
jgi:hypothetical protein